MIYGLDALRRLREQQAQPIQESVRQAAPALRVPADAPMDDATITAWNSQRFLAYDRWLATTPIETDAQPVPTIPAGARRVAGECGETKVWLVKDGERWFMYVGSKKAGGRGQREFATPFLAHAIRTAEQWYGMPGGGWRVEKGRDGAGTKSTADLPPQDSTAQKGAGRRGDDDVDLDGREPGRT